MKCKALSRHIFSSEEQSQIIIGEKKANQQKKSKIIIHLVPKLQVGEGPKFRINILFPGKDGDGVTTALQWSHNRDSKQDWNVSKTQNNTRNSHYSETLLK